MAEVKVNGVKTVVNGRVRPATPGDEIVISGISGKFPSAKNVSEFAHKLYNKVNKCSSENTFDYENLTIRRLQRQ